MKRYLPSLFVISILIVFLYPLPAMSQAVYLKALQRGWAEKEYSDTEKADELSLAGKALDIVQWNIQDASALNLIEKTSGKIPELMDYILMRYDNVPDTLYKNKRKALKGISDFLGRKAPESDEYLWSLYFYEVAKADSAYNPASFAKLIEFLSKEVKKNNSPRRRALLSIAKIDDFNYRNPNTTLMDEQDYLEIYRLEKEALQNCPRNNEDATIETAILYHHLGNLKYSFADDFMAWMCNGENADEFLPDCIYIGEMQLAPSNSGFYFEKALDIARDRLNPGHPLTQYLNFQKNIFEFSFNRFSETLYKDAEAYNEYVKLYFPDTSIENALSKVIFTNRSLALGNFPPEAENMVETMDIIKAFMGVKNPEYIKIIETVGSEFPALGLDPQYWKQRMIDELTEAGLSPHSDESLMYQLISEINKFFMNDENAIQKIYEIEARYRNSHSGNPLSVELGHRLASFFSLVASDNKRGAEIMDIAFRDFDNSIPGRKEDNLLWWKYLLENNNLRAEYADGSEIEKNYGELLSKADNIDARYRDKLKYYVLKLWIIFNINNTGDTVTAINLLEKNKDIFSRSEPYGDFFSEMESAYIKDLSGELDRRKEVAEHLNNAMAIARKALNNRDTLRLKYYEFTPLVATLKNNGEINRAIEMASLQSDIYKMTNKEIFTLEYFDQCVQMARLYEIAGRKNEARRLLADCIDKMKGSPLFYVNTYLIDLLWEDYYLAKEENIKDLSNYIYKLTEISNLTNRLFKNSNEDKTIHANYSAKAATEFLFLYSTFWTYMDRDIAAGLIDNPDALKEFLERNGYNSIVPAAYSVLEEFQTEIPEYESNSNYNSLISALAYYHDSVLNDKLTAEAFYLKLLNSDIDIWAKVDIYANLARYAAERNDFEKWGLYLDKVETLIAELPYPDEDELFNLDIEKTEYHIKKGEYDRALNYARNYYLRNKNILDGNFQLMTSNEQKNYMEAHGDPAVLLCNLLEYSPEKLSSEVYDAVIYRTGMQLRSDRATKEALEKSDDPAIKEMLQNIRILQNEANRYSVLMSKEVPGSSSGNNVMSEYSEAKRKLNLLEGQLLDATAKYRPKGIEDVSWEMVRNKLDKNEAAIEFVFADKAVMALIVKADSEKPEAIRLCDQNELLTFLSSQNVKNSSSLAKKLYSNAENALYKKLWQPLEASLKGINTIYYTLPGILNNLSFNAFKNDCGVYLFDLYDLNQLTTTARLSFDAKPLKMEKIGIMGNISYSNKPKTISNEKNEEESSEENFDLTEDPETRSVSKGYFRHLPFTAEEIEAVSALFKDKDIITSQHAEATETAFREMTNFHPDILHLATHGFYLSSYGETIKMPFYRNRVVNSMNRSGVALAGAEETWRGKSTEPDEKDGILTAEEVALLDLSGTSLVALSACETALGDYSFEGVYGLQRGFKQAGVNSLLVSLWMVNDRSTSLFMKTFYQELNSGHSQQTSWRKAVEEVRKDYPEPYYWAPFVLIDGI